LSAWAIYRNAATLGILSGIIGVFPFLIYHGLSGWNALLMVMLAPPLSILASRTDIWAVSRDSDRFVDTVYVAATAPTVMLLLLQAIGWTAIRYFESGQLWPTERMHTIAIVSAVTAFVLWVLMSRYLYRRRHVRRG